MLSNNQVTVLSFAVDYAGESTREILNNTNQGSMASVRIQLKPAMEALNELKYTARVFSLHSEYPEHLDLITPSKACLIGKMSANTKEKSQSMAMANLAAITRLKNQGAKIIVQHSDNMFHRKDVMTWFYQDIFKIADHIIFPSNSLKKISEKYMNQNTSSSVISDPWQLISNHEPLKGNPKDGLKLIWFGSNKNICYLLKILPKLLIITPASSKHELTILAQPWALKKTQTFIKSLGKINWPGWRIRLVVWLLDNQPEQLEKELSRAHIALIPSDPTDPLKAGVSHNRLVDSIRGGCVSLASPMESYKELSEASIIGDDLPELFKQTTENYAQQCDLLIKNREKLLSQFNPAINRSNWVKFWKSVI